MSQMCFEIVGRPPTFSEGSAQQQERDVTPSEIPARKDLSPHEVCPCETYFLTTGRVTSVKSNSTALFAAAKRRTRRDAPPV